MQNRRDGRAVRDHTVATSPSFAVKRMRHLEPDSSEGDSGLLLWPVWSLSASNPGRRQIALEFFHLTPRLCLPICGLNPCVPLGSKGGVDRP